MRAKGRGALVYSHHPEQAGNAKRWSGLNGGRLPGKIKDVLGRGLKRTIGKHKEIFRSFRKFSGFHFEPAPGRQTWG